jgi:hypothetical protein
MYYEQQLPPALGYNFIKRKIVSRDGSGIWHARKSGKSP